VEASIPLLFRSSHSLSRCAIRTGSFTRLAFLSARRANAALISISRQRQRHPLGDWQLDSDLIGLWLSIPRSKLEGLLRSLPRKAGLEQVFSTGTDASFAVTFEVDLQRDSKAAA
jgi:hypothetical protein